MFDFGVLIQHAVSPALYLFTVEGFAPLLAFLMLAAALLIGSWNYFIHILGGKSGLKKAARIARSI